MTTFQSNGYSGWTDPRLQKDILRWIDKAQWNGLTTQELRQLTVDHHGWVSGATSTLHADLKVVRLTEKRDGHKIYVTPDFIDSRACEAQGWGKTVTKEQRVWYDRLTEVLDYWLQVDTAGAKFKTDKTKAERHLVLFFRALKDVWKDRPR